MKRLPFCIYLYLGHDFLRPYKKIYLFTIVKYLWLILELSKQMFFHIFHDLSFLQDYSKFYSQIQVVGNQFILHPKSITVLVSFQIFVIKGCFLIIQ